MISKDEFLKIERCSPLLPNPGPEVVEKLLGHIFDLESRLKAATELGPCGHPKMFWQLRLVDSHMRTEMYCTLCAEVQAAYERGLRDAAEIAQRHFNDSSMDSGRIPLANAKKAILAQKDRDAKSGRG